MTINDEVAVGSLLVLADSSLDQRSSLQRRKAEVEIFANSVQCFRADDPLAGSGVERRAAGVDSYFEAAPVVSRNAVDESSVVISPDRQLPVAEARIAGGCAEEEYILLG